MIFEIIHDDDKIQFNIDNQYTTFDFLDGYTLMNNVRYSDKIQYKLFLELLDTIKVFIPIQRLERLFKQKISFLKVDTHKDIFKFRLADSDLIDVSTDKTLQSVIFAELIRQLTERMNAKRTRN